MWPKEKEDLQRFFLKKLTSEKLKFQNAADLVGHWDRHLQITQKPEQSDRRPTLNIFERTLSTP